MSLRRLVARENCDSRQPSHWPFMTKTLLQLALSSSYSSLYPSFSPSYSPSPPFSPRSSLFRLGISIFQSKCLKQKQLSSRKPNQATAKVRTGEQASEQE